MNPLILLFVLSWQTVIALSITVIFVCYITFTIIISGNFITTSIPTGAFFEADQYYFLPTAEISISVTVTYALKVKQIDNSFIDAKITQIDLTNTTRITSDVSKLFKLSYKASPFANDEIRLSTNADGLLENVSATAEDKIGVVLSQIALSPQKITSFKSVGEPLILSDHIVKNISATRTFILNAQDLTKEEIVKDWLINIESIAGSSPLDASLRFNIKDAVGRYDYSPDSRKPELKGILTRPMTKLKVSVYLAEQITSISVLKNRTFKDIQELNFEITVPDISKLILVPISRTPFIKKNQIPKFSNGLLTENYINKPSEFEGIISIPIDIAKAIFSIPAQLLTFKISHLQQQNSLETETQKLLAAEALRKKATDESKHLKKNK